MASKYHSPPDPICKQSGADWLGPCKQAASERLNALLEFTSAIRKRYVTKQIIKNAPVESKVQRSADPQGRNFPRQREY
eukprot:754273-Hanusia_phi.AAC.3